MKCCPVVSLDFSSKVRKAQETDKGAWVCVCPEVKFMAWNNNNHLFAYDSTIWVGLCRDCPSPLHKALAGSSQGSYNQELGWGWTSKEASLSHLGPDLWWLECWRLAVPLSLQLGQSVYLNCGSGLYKSERVHRGQKFLLHSIDPHKFPTRFKEMKVKSTVAGRSDM